MNKRKNQIMSSNEIDEIYASGFLNGLGEEKEVCKYPVGTEQYDLWNQAQIDGLRSYFKSLKKSTNVKST